MNNTLKAVLLPDDTGENPYFKLVQQYYNDFLRYGTKFTANPEFARETVNNFFLHLWDKRNKLSAVENMKGYLLVSFRHFLIQELRKQRNAALAEKYIEVVSEPPYETHIIAKEEAKRSEKILQDAIATLPRRQKELLLLRYYGQLSYNEIATQTSLTVRTVYNKLNEALKKLRSNPILAKLN